MERSAGHHPMARGHAQPPRDFDPLSASDARLAQFGYPPRPDAQTAPDRYAVWKKVVTAPQQRLAPALGHTTIHNGRARMVSQGGGAPGLARNARSGIANDAASVTTMNWSGYAVVDPQNPFQSGTTVYGEWVVPVAQQAAGTCSGTWDYSSEWVGIDGFTSSDVLQSGIEVDAFCANGSTMAFYSAWYEWYPDVETRITNLPIAPGNIIGVEVWNTGPTQGNAYIVNYTTQQSVSLAFNAPAGTSLVGDSVEWIVERPQVNGSFAALTHYVAEPFNFCHAAAGAGTYTPGASPTGTAYSIDMIDDNGVGPIVLSSPNLYGTAALWFYEPGPAEQ
ncbi:MAG TPA: G1 family glutamic endopeptidase [Stellaceae bacterium]|nr:G1 family glutamic endopeptidase [Stellaceae bacterium]